MNIQREITEFLKKTPIKSEDLKRMTEQAESESWQVALNTFLRFHDLALSVMRKNQIQGVDLELTKQTIIDRLEASWLSKD